MNVSALRNVRSTLPARVIAFTFVYALLGTLGLALLDVPMEAVELWPAAGFATALLLIGDRRLWPGIPLGFLLMYGLSRFLARDLTLPEPMLAPPLVGAAAATLQAGLAVMLVDRQFGKETLRLGSKRDWLELSLYVGPLSCAVSAVFGGLGLHLANGTTGAPLLWAMLNWWVGSVLGILLVLPPVLLWPTTKKRRLHWRGHPLPTMSQLTALAASVGLILTFSLAQTIKNADTDKNRELFAGAVDRGEAHLLHEYVSLKAVLNAAALDVSHEAGDPTHVMNRLRSPDKIYNLTGMNGFGIIQPSTSGTSRRFHPEIKSVFGGQELEMRYFESTASGAELRGRRLQWSKQAKDAAEKAVETGDTEIAPVTLSASKRSPIPQVILLQAAFDHNTHRNTPEARRNALIGWVFLLVSPEKVFGPDVEKQAKGAYLAAASIGGGSGAADHFTPIFASGPNSHTPRFRSTHAAEVFGRTWRFSWSSTPWFEAATADQTPVIVLYGGLLLTALAAGLVQAMSDREKRVREALDLAQEREQELVSLTENAPVPMSVLSRDGRFLIANDAFLAFVGYPEKAIIGAKVNELPQIKDIEGLAAHLGEMLSGKKKSIVMEMHYVRPNGDGVDGIVTASVLHSSSQRELKFIVQIVDITERKHLERMKGDFVATVSHELRTPLTSISGSIALILGTMADDMPNKARHMLDIAQNNAKRLGTLVNDLLDMQKVATGNITLEKVETDVGAVMREAASETDAYAKRFGVRFKLSLPEEPLSAKIDINRFKQVMANLISNAAKFSPEGGQIEIVLERGAGRNRQFACVSVTDHGRGIPPEFRNRIFKPFSQAVSSSTRDREGTGLGLVISKEIVEKMGGTIGFDSEPNVRTTFWFRFPIGAAT